MNLTHAAVAINWISLNGLVRHVLGRHRGRRWAALLLTFFAWCGPGIRAADLQVDLGGTWTFAMDALGRGEQLGWAAPTRDWTGDKPHPAAGWDSVTVPHDFLSDPRYAYTGAAWYRRSFAVPETAEPGCVWRLQFDQVSQRCRVWLNGELVGRHEGGYTPFEIDLGAKLHRGRQNLLVVEVDNTIRLHALPGARTGGSPNDQLFPWLNYGGILGPVSLVAHAPVYIVRQQIEATPGEGGAAGRFVTHLLVRNATAQMQSAELSVTVGADLNVTRVVSLPALSEQRIALQGKLPTALQRWTLEEPTVYVAEATVRSSGLVHQRQDTFGVRTLATRGGQFLLNDRPVRLAGANRARGHGRFGGLDPDAAVREDLELMKAAGLRFARLQHTPPQRNLLEWADRNGMLLILEVGVWGHHAADLASTELRQQFQREMSELIALAANHPSVVGWSVGNEYESWTAEGIAWTRDMTAAVRQMDPTRPVTFAALGTVLRRLRGGQDGSGPHAFDFVDLIATNLYFPPSEVPGYLDPIHARWPGKPVMISEFGLRSDRVADESERLKHFDAMLAVARTRPWVCGLAYWSFNDYASHYPGSGADGYRRWGMVDEFRRPRPLYEHVRRRVSRGLDE